jgi:hypothetical protein
MRMRIFAPVILIITFAATLLASGASRAQLTLPTLPPATMPSSTPSPSTPTSITPPAPQSGSKQAAAEECLSKPGAAGPPGSHWYYRVDRATKRQCWYLGTAGAKMARQSDRNKRSSAAPPAEPVAEQGEPPAPAQPAPAPTEGASAQGVTTPFLPYRTGLDQAAPNPVAAVQTPTATSAGEAAADQTPDLRRSQGAADPAPAGNGDAQEQPATESEDDMPLVWPVLTPAELAAAGLGQSSTVKPALMLAVLVGALAFAAVIARLLFKLFGTRQGDRAVARDQRRPAQSAPVPGRSAAPARGHRSAQDASVQRPSAQRPSAQVAAERLADALRSPTVAAPRLGDIPPRPARAAPAGRDLKQDSKQGLEQALEDDLQTLLRGLQRSAA